MWRAYAIRPYIFTICSLGDAVIDGVICISFSPPTVGAYRIRPDVSEQEMTAASILSFFREHFPSLGMFAAVEGVCDTPLHFYY